MTERLDLLTENVATPRIATMRTEGSTGYHSYCASKPQHFLKYLDRWILQLHCGIFHFAHFSFSLSVDNRFATTNALSCIKIRLALATTAGSHSRVAIWVLAFLQRPLLLFKVTALQDISSIEEPVEAGGLLLAFKKTSHKVLISK